jgi:hypothetical protein
VGVAGFSGQKSGKMAGNQNVLCDWGGFVALLWSKNGG